MARVDYYNVPDAPAPNRLVPAVHVVARDGAGLLMVHRVDSDLWALPGGEMVVGETVADAAIRTVRARTGVRVEITGLVGLYTSPGHVLAHDGGEVDQEFSVCFHGRPLEGAPRPAGGEVDAAEWVTAEDLDGRPVHPATRTRINDALADRARPRIA